MLLERIEKIKMSRCTGAKIIDDLFYSSRSVLNVVKQSVEKSTEDTLRRTCFLALKIVINDWLLNESNVALVRHECKRF